jgi:hypothetical protein
MSAQMEDERFYTYFNRAYTELTNSNTAPWLKEGIPERDIAYNPASGVIFKGVNSILLEMDSARKGFKDNRWVSAEECEKYGLKPRYRETPTPVAYINKYTHPTDVNPVTGKPFQTEKKKYYLMYNIEQLHENELSKQKANTFSYDKIEEKARFLCQNARCESVQESIQYYGSKVESNVPQMKSMAKALTEFRLCQELQKEYKPPVLAQNLKMENALNKNLDSIIRAVYTSEVQKDRAVNEDNSLEKGLKRTVEKDKKLSRSMEMTM